MRRDALTRPLLRNLSFCQAGQSNQGLRVQGNHLLFATHNVLKSTLYSREEVIVLSRFADQDLVVEGDSFRWEKGNGTYQPTPKHLPYTNATPALQKSSQTKRRKNVLLIVCDDLNTHVSPSGYDPIHGRIGQIL